MVAMILAHFLRDFVRYGRLTVIDATGRRCTAVGPQPGPSVTARLHDRSMDWRLLVDPSLAVGEGYMDGRITVEDGDLYDLLALCMLNLSARHGRWAPFDMIERVQWMLRTFAQRNGRDTARRNVAHHYDLSDAMYDLFLDRDRQYSCAYFTSPNDTLEQAQRAKQRHLAAKLMLAPGQRVLDVGSGWGGLALNLARLGNCDVTGITLSPPQREVAERRAAEAGLASRVRYQLVDFRDVVGPFDRIVSVGMFEHVGLPNYREFFRRIADLLTDDGVAVLHSIGRADGPGATNAWIRKYIFPGGYSPALSEVLPWIERAGLFATDIEVLRLHYAETLRHWRKRFMAARDEVARIYDERFCRMWEFYLAGSEATFRFGGHMVFQIQLAKRVDAVPLTRDYMYETERRIASAVAAE
jgi:cyclopropane-fatty-acyl-phospholipid synthase